MLFIIVLSITVTSVFSAPTPQSSGCVAPGFEPEKVLYGYTSKDVQERKQCLIIQIDSKKT